MAEANKIPSNSNTIAAEERKEYWEQIIKEQKASGKNMAKFCRERSISVHKLKYWKYSKYTKQKQKKLAKQETPKDKLYFTPLQVEGDDISCNQGMVKINQIEIKFKNGHVLNIAGKEMENRIPVIIMQISQLP